VISVQDSDSSHGRVGASDRSIPQIALDIDRPEREALLLAFGENLRSPRTEAGVSQSKVAARCFLRPDHISGLECGIKAPTLMVPLAL
jgi:hypothetical protein